MTTFSEKGTAAPKENFTGTVWVNLNVDGNDPYNAVIATVTFEPGGRTNWHSHTSGQILFIIEGTGYYQEKGKPIQLIRQGDVVKIPKNTEHWHGASHSAQMRHVAIITEKAADKTEWYQPVSNEEYNSFQPAIANNYLSAKAIANHERLWPEYIATFKTTDPDLIGIFDNFAFDEIIAHDDMDEKTRVLLILASTIGSSSLTEFRMFVNAALNIGISPIAIKEVVYQAVPYAGISKVIDFVSAVNEIFIERNIELPLASQSVTTPATRHDKGYAMQKQIVGEKLEQMYSSSPEDLLHIQYYLSDNCFGDYITRGGLDLKTRELVTLSFLMALGGTEPQIKGHIQGNINVGNNRQTLINAMTQLLPYLGYPRTLNAINCLNEIIPANNKQ